MVRPQIPVGQPAKSAPTRPVTGTEQPPSTATTTDATARSNATARPRTPPNAHSPKQSGTAPDPSKLDTDPRHHRLHARRSLVERDRKQPALPRHPAALP